MPKRLFMGPILFILLSCSSAFAQSVCPLNGTSSSKLVCVIPQVYGPYGLGSGATAPLLADGHQAHFEGDFLSSFGPINEAVGIQVSQLPIASPSSGISFVFDPALKTFSPSTETSLGPILGQHAGTIGRNKLYVAFSFQYFNFNSIDGQNIANLPAAFKHETFPPPFPSPFITACPNQTALAGTVFAGNPCFVRDYIQTMNNIDLTVHQYALYATYGITRHLDVSVEVPILNINMKMTSKCLDCAEFLCTTVAEFPWRCLSPVQCRYRAELCGATPCLNATFSSSGNATGIGDVLLRGKYELYQGERLGLALEWMSACRLATRKISWARAPLGLSPSASFPTVPGFRHMPRSDMKKMDSRCWQAISWVRPRIPKGRFPIGSYIRWEPMLRSLSDSQARLISMANVCSVSRNFSPARIPIWGIAATSIARR